MQMMYSGRQCFRDFGKPDREGVYCMGRASRCYGARRRVSNGHRMHRQSHGFRGAPAEVGPD